MRFMQKFQWNCEIAIIVSISKKEDSSLESILFLEILVKCIILVLSVFFGPNWVVATICSAIYSLNLLDLENCDKNCD